MQTQKAINILLAVFTAVSCLIAINNNAIYQDGEWANAQWLGQDIITLTIALPLLILTFIKGFQDNRSKWLIINSGILLYFAYTYSFYVFAAKLTYLYLFQVPIFGLSTIGFVRSCITLFTGKWKFNLPNSPLRLSIIIYLAIIALLLSFIWLSDIFAHLTNPAHQSDTPNGEAPLIIYSLDLAIILPLMLISAILLYKKTDSSYIFSGIILTKTSTLGFALMAMALSLYLQNLNPSYYLIILWCTIGCVGTLLTFLFFRNLKLE